LLLIFCFASITLVSSKCIIGDCINGQVIYSFSNGDKYVGEFREGKLHGNGTLYFSSGDEYVGKFNNGKLNGKGIYSYNTGAIYLGYFRENKIDLFFILAFLHFVFFPLLIGSLLFNKILF